MSPQAHVLWDAAIVNALSHAAESAGVAQSVAAIADDLPIGAGIADVCFRGVGIVHVLRNVAGNVSVF